LNGVTPKTKPYSSGYLVSPSSFKSTNQNNNEDEEDKMIIKKEEIEKNNQFMERVIS